MVRVMDMVLGIALGLSAVLVAALIVAAILGLRPSGFPGSRPDTVGPRDEDVSPDRGRGGAAPGESVEDVFKGL